jgi:RimJ/RimL family protein N-acetyltransferase
MKATAGTAGREDGLAVGRPAEVFLRPVPTRAGWLNSADIRLLSEWRNRSKHAFLTEFEANEERTARWLIEVVGPDDTRILFMVKDARSGESVGYMGLASIDWAQGTGEADAVVRGSNTRPGAMKTALLTLLRWAHDCLGLRALGVRVRSDNPAVTFYQKVGFFEVRRVPLRRSNKPDMVQWVEDESLPPGEPSLIHMALAAAILEGPNN